MRSLLPLLFTGLSVYLIILYSSDFWRAVAGYLHLSLAIILFILSVLTLNFSFIYMKKPLERNLVNLVFSGVLCLVVCGVFLFITTPTQRRIYVLKLEILFDSLNSQYQAIFNETYPTVNLRQGFLYTRTIEVHDSIMSILMFWFVLTGISYYKENFIISSLGEDRLPSLNDKIADILKNKSEKSS